MTWEVFIIIYFVYVFMDVFLNNIAKHPQLLIFFYQTIFI